MTAPISCTPAVERIARVLAGERLSVNGGGSERSAAADVDSAWPDHEAEARAILRTLREPDRAMAAAGDAAIWERMVLAALGDALPPRDSAGEPAPVGSDPFTEGP